VFGEKPGVGKPIVRPKHGWEGNIKIVIKVRIIGWKVVDGIIRLRIRLL
jgi:hypothetical protein